jgi:hypothetical protein
MNLVALHEWLVAEHDYHGSLRSVQRYWRRTYPAPAMRARRRVETPAGAQSEFDWAHFPGLIVGGERVDLLALHRNPRPVAPSLHRLRDLEQSLGVQQQ